jgi:D-glycero-D-manno-heptose 1,7-bisphosphate phosphatase
MKAIVFDRDGTLIEDAHYPSYDWQIKLKRGIKNKLFYYKNRGFKFFLISNQSGIKRGYFSYFHLTKLHHYIESLIYPIKFESVFYCIHHPNERCLCRKPQNHFLKKIIWNYNPREIIVVGDRLSDQEMAHSLNVEFIHISTFLS